MRIPHLINESTLKVYTPSPQSLDLIGEDIRTLISENFEWDKDQLPTLTDICVWAIGKYFEQKPLLNELPCADREHLLEVLSVELPLELIIPLIDDEYYWKRRYQDHFGLITQTRRTDWTWKNLYIERHVQKLVEEAQPQYSDEESYDELFVLCCPYVKRLIATQLQYWQPALTMDKEDIPEVYPIEHINFLPIFRKLTLIEEFDAVYGMNNVGEDFEWEMFKVSAADCSKLGRALLELKDIKIVRIHRSKIEYKQCQALMQALIKNTTITELDLSNCRLGDKGALCVAKYLQAQTTLKILNLSNNDIGKIGAEGLGFSMVQNTNMVLEVLDMSINPLRNDGTMGIMRALVRIQVPSILSMAACVFEDDTPLKVCQMIKLVDILHKLDISSNWFGEEGGEGLVNAMSQNTTLQWLDVRETDITLEQESKIRKFLLRNRNKLNESDEESGEEDETEVEDESTPAEETKEEVVVSDAVVQEGEQEEFIGTVLPNEE